MYRKKRHHNCHLHSDDCTDGDGTMKNDEGYEDSADEGYSDDEISATSKIIDLLV